MHGVMMCRLCNSEGRACAGCVGGGPQRGRVDDAGAGRG